jgi:hypothetical protein
MVTVLAVALSLAGPAFAATSPGVHVDPGSPASKEYAIPLSNARGSGSGHSGSLFGSGITSGGGPKAGAGVSVAPTTHPATPKKPRAHHHQASVPVAKSAQPVSVTPASAPAALKVLHPGSGSGVAWMIGVAALVLVLGGGAALIARRGRPGRRRPPAHPQRGASELS